MGNVIVPPTLLTDSSFWDVYDPRILIFEPDSLWIMAQTSDSAWAAGFRYAALDWSGNLMRPVEVFSICADVYGPGWWLQRTPDRSIVLVAISPGFNDLRVVVQNPDGFRPMDCEIAFDIRPCGGPVGFVDVTDSLQLIWRQFPSWNAIYTKRIGIRDHIPPNSVGDYVALTPAMPGFARAPGYVVSLNDTLFLLREGHNDSEFGLYLRIIDSRTYETYSSTRVGALGQSPVVKIEVVGDTMAAIAVYVSNDWGILIRGYSLTDLSTTFETDSLWVTDQHDGWFSLMAYAASPYGHHHVVYNVPPIEEEGGTGYLGYQMWKSGPFTTSHERQVAAKDVRLFPNPTNGDIFVSGSFPLSGTATIYNVLGQAVSQISIPPGGPSSQLLPVPLNGLPSGVYFMSLESNNFVMLKKFLLLK